LATVAKPTFGNSGLVPGVAYLMLIVQVPPGASGVVNEQVVPVEVNSVLKKPVTASAVICRLPAPVLVIVTTLVTGARGVGMVNVNTRPRIVVARVALVAEVKLSVPGVTAVPVSVTGVPVPVAGPMAPLKATVRLPVKFVPFAVPVGGLNTTLKVQAAPTARVVPQLPPPPPPACVKGVAAPKVKVPPLRASLPVLVTVMVLAVLVVPVPWFPKASVLGDTVKDALPGADPNSIAPGSNRAGDPSLGSGRRFP
jgi:hypothetical protein